MSLGGGPRGAKIARSLQREIRYLDKLIDELAKDKAIANSG